MVVRWFITTFSGTPHLAYPRTLQKVLGVPQLGSGLTMVVLISATLLCQRLVDSSRGVIFLHLQHLRTGLQVVEGSHCFLLETQQQDSEHEGVS